MIVEIAQRLEHAVLRAKHSRDQFLRRRLTGRSCDPDERLAPMFPHGSGQCLKGSERIRRAEQGKVFWELRQPFGFPPRRHCTATDRAGNILMAVEVFSMNG